MAGPFKLLLLLCLLQANTVLVSAKPMEQEEAAEGVVNMKIDQVPPTNTENQWQQPPIDRDPNPNEADSGAFGEDLALDDTEAGNQQPVGNMAAREEVDWGKIDGQPDWGDQSHRQQAVNQHQEAIEQYRQQHEEEQQQQQEKNEEEQQQQQQQQQQKEQEKEQQQQQQEEEEVLQQLKDSAEGHMQAVGVMDPEEIMHGDDPHEHETVSAPGHADGEEQPCLDCKAKEQDALKQAELRQEAEREQIQVLQPQVKTNVHDGQQRTAAEFMKNRQYGPVDVEEIMHQGHNVHGEGHEGRRGQLLGGDVEMLTHGEGGVHADHVEKKEHSTFDPEHLMHAGQGGDHYHNPHEKKDPKDIPGAPGGPEDLMRQERTRQAPQKKAPENTGPVGPLFEKAVHGEDHVHDYAAEHGQPARNKIKYQDIIDLGLTEDQLKGIDLSQLLEQEQLEFDIWQKEAAKEADDDYSKEEGSIFQQRAMNLRKQYLQKLYAKVRELTPPDLEHAEWDEDEDRIRQVHEGESQLEHEMEMWGSTVAKTNRKPYKVVQGRRGMNEWGEDEGQGEERYFNNEEVGEGDDV